MICEIEEIQKESTQAERKYIYGNSSTCNGCGLKRFLKYEVYCCHHRTKCYKLGSECKDVIEVAQKMALHNCKKNPQSLIDEYLELLE